MEKSLTISGTRPRSFTLGTATIGSQNWQNSTLRDMKLCNTIVTRSDKNCDLGRHLDPLPHFRETVVELSNNEAHRYAREVRAVVTRLQECLLDINEEIKSMIKQRKALEKALDNRRQDIKMNRDSIESRSARPHKERDIDGADDLLNAERQHLLNLKRSLESHLKSVQNQLQVLDSARTRVQRCMRERSRVLDLACHTRSASATLASGRTTPVSGRPSSRQTTMGFSVDPLGAFTPEVQEALRDAAEAMKDSKKLRSDLADVIARTDQLRNAAMESVNRGLQDKLNETNALKQQLMVSSGQIRNAINRSQRWLDATGQAYGYHVGPLSSAHLTTGERLTRPLIRVYQRHPGTQLPEAQHVIASTAGFVDSMNNTEQNIQLLRLAQNRVHDNYKQKEAASEVDRSVLRMRRRRGGDQRSMAGQA